MMLIRPFKDKIFNIFMISIEVCVFMCYPSSGGFLISKLDHEVLMWIILGCIYCSCFLLSGLGYYKIFVILYPIIRGYFARRSNNQHPIS